MNIAYVVHHYDSSEGTGGYTVELAKRVARHHDVTVYAVGVRAPVPDGVQVVRVPALRGRAYATILSFPPAFAAVRRPHDVVHAQGWVTGHADVVTAHIVLRAWRNAARGAGVAFPFGERAFGGFVERREQRLYCTAPAVIAPSAKVQAELAQWYGRDRDVTVVRHAFPASQDAVAREQARQQLGLSSQGFVALYVGDARKGLETAMRAVAAVEGVQLLVVTRSSAEPFRVAGRNLALGDRLRWAGSLSDTSVAYAAADVLLHPTIYDSFGLVVAEAMANGTPPIVTKTAGIVELIRHRESGWIVDEDVLSGATAALTELSHNPSLLARLSAGAREQAALRTWDDVTLETLAVYEHVTQ